MRSNIYRKYRCTVKDCKLSVYGAISHGTKPDGTFKMHYFCPTHYKAADDIKKQEWVEHCKKNNIVEEKPGLWIKQKTAC